MARSRIAPRGIAVERLRQRGNDLRGLKNDGVYRVLDHASAIAPIELDPRDILPFARSYAASPARGFVVRVIQFAVNGNMRWVIGGQTFVVGEVAGVTRRLQSLPNNGAVR
jgi:hypothetical protein